MFNVDGDRLAIELDDCAHLSADFCEGGFGVSSLNWKF